MRNSLVDIIHESIQDKNIDQDKLLKDWLDMTAKYEVPLESHNYILCIDKLYENYKNGKYNIQKNGGVEYETKKSSSKRKLCKKTGN